MSGGCIYLHCFIAWWELYQVWFEWYMFLLLLLSCPACKLHCRWLEAGQSAAGKLWYPRDQRAWCGEFGTSSVVSGPREVCHASRSPGSSRKVRSSVLETISTLTILVLCRICWLHWLNSSQGCHPLMKPWSVRWMTVHPAAQHQHHYHSRQHGPYSDVLTSSRAVLKSVSWNFTVPSRSVRSLTTSYMMSLVAWMKLLTAVKVIVSFRLIVKSIYHCISVNRRSFDANCIISPFECCLLFVYLLLISACETSTRYQILYFWVF